MATQNAMLSVTIQDVDGDEKAFTDYVKYDDATATLAGLITAFQSEVGLIDDITDGKVVSASFTLNPALPGGLKANAVAGSDVEKVGLLTWNTSSNEGLTYSQAIPAFYAAGFTGDVVNDTETAMVNWKNQMTTPGTINSSDDRRAWMITGYKKGRKSFRK